MSMVAGLLGGLFALGLVAFAVAMRPVVPGDLPARKRLTSSGSSIQLDQLTIRIVIGGVGALVVGLVTQWPIAAVLVGVGGFFAPSLMGGGAERKKQLDVIEGVASWAEMLRDTMAGAGGLEQSIIATAALSPWSIRPQVLRLAASLERNQLTPSLQRFAEELDDPAGDLVVAALLLASDKSPRRLGDLLGRLSQSARADVAMRLRIEAARARVRTSVRVIVGFTVFFAVGLLVFNRDYLDPYDSFVGQVVIGAIGTCFGIAFWWLGKSSQFSEQERFLRADLEEVLG